MDWMTLKMAGAEIVKKYRFVLIVILAGIFLMALPVDKKGTSSDLRSAEQPRETSLEDSLAEILSLIHGAGRVKVLLTECSGSETWYQTDEDTDSDGSGRKTTVLYTGTDRTESGLVRRVDPPVYRGAVVLCQGADSPAVRLAIVEAVANATGLTTDQISVLKMK